MSDFDLLLLVAGALGTARWRCCCSAPPAMTGTGGREPTLIEVMLAVGFNQEGPVRYRTVDGSAVIIERCRLAYVMVEPWQTAGTSISDRRPRRAGRVHVPCHVHAVAGGASLTPLLTQVKVGRQMGTRISGDRR